MCEFTVRLNIYNIHKHCSEETSTGDEEMRRARRLFYILFFFFNVTLCRLKIPIAAARFFGLCAVAAPRTTIRGGGLAAAGTDIKLYFNRDRSRILMKLEEKKEKRRNEMFTKRNPVFDPESYYVPRACIQL